MINDLYSSLLEYDLTFNDLYDMTVRELIDTLKARKQGLAYRMWKEAYLIAWATMGKKYPQSPSQASPELYPPKPRIKMPEMLLRKKGSSYE